MIMAIAVSLATGVSMVVSRILNARLAESTSKLTSTVINYVTGLIVSSIVMVIAGASIQLQQVPVNRLWIYCGGLMGMVVVMVSNWITAKISAMYQTLLLFVGQVFAGVTIDALLQGRFSPGLLAGGVLVGVGLLFCLWVDSRGKPSAVPQDGSKETKP